MLKAAGSGEGGTVQNKNGGKESAESVPTPERIKTSSSHLPGSLQTTLHLGNTLLSVHLLDPDIQPHLPSNPSASTALALQPHAWSRRWYKNQHPWLQVLSPRF